MCARSRLDIVVFSVEPIIFVWIWIYKKLYVDNGKLIRLKYVTFHFVLKELILTYSINYKKKWLRIFYDGLSFV
jgi:hypothetical protein